MSRLQVMSNDAVVGTLSQQDAGWRFDYAPHWQAWPLAPTFPLATGSFQDHDGQRAVEWFFENLLPEGRLRDLRLLQTLGDYFLYRYAPAQPPRT